MICERRPDLHTWIETAAHSRLASFANGTQKDRKAVAAALTPALVERPDRGADHPPQAREATDVWPGQARSARSSADRCRLRPTASRVRQPPVRRRLTLWTSSTSSVPSRTGSAGRRSSCSTVRPGSGLRPGTNFRQIFRRTGLRVTGITLDADLSRFRRPKKRR